MKEVMAVIRMNMINKTKDSLVAAGFPSLTARKVFGRGKKAVNSELIEGILTSENPEIASPKVVESISEGNRLIQKRLITLIVNDEEVEKVVNTIMEVNSSGHPGDGKIFIIPIDETIRVRTGESGTIAI